MFPEPDHDARVVAEALRTQALAGFFCGGEIGPVGGRPWGAQTRSRASEDVPFVVELRDGGPGVKVRR
jgi:hypothetical protein